MPEETLGVPPLEAPEGAETTGTLVADPVGHQPGTLAELTIAVDDEALEVSVPLLDATLPADGDYFVRVSEFAYQQGGPDYFYRLTVAAGPWIDAVFPPAVNPGQPTKVTLHGRNLPGGNAGSLTAALTPPADQARLARNAMAKAVIR